MALLFGATSAQAENADPAREKFLSGDFRGAREILFDAFLDAQARYGADSDEVADSLMRLALPVALDRGVAAGPHAAGQLYLRAYRIRAARHGADSLEAAHVIDALARADFGIEVEPKSGSVKLAGDSCPSLKRAAAIREKALGPASPEFAISVENLRWTDCDDDLSPNARRARDHASEIWRAAAARGGSAAARDLEMAARRESRPEDAKADYLKLIEAPDARETLGDADYMGALLELARLSDSLHARAEANGYLDRALDIAQGEPNLLAGRVAHDVAIGRLTPNSSLEERALAQRAAALEEAVFPQSLADCEARLTYHLGPASAYDAAADRRAAEVIGDTPLAVWKLSKSAILAGEFPVRRTCSTTSVFSILADDLAKLGGLAAVERLSGAFLDFVEARHGVESYDYVAALDGVAGLPVFRASDADAWRQSLRAAVAARAWLDAHPDDPAGLRLFLGAANRLPPLALRVGHAAEAVPFSERAWALKEQSNLADRDLAAAQLGALYAAVGRDGDAEAMFQRGVAFALVGSPVNRSPLDVRPSFDITKVLQALDQLGDFYASRHRMREALQTRKRALAMAYEPYRDFSAKAEFGAVMLEFPPPPPPIVARLRAYAAAAAEEGEPNAATFATRADEIERINLQLDLNQAALVLGPNTKVYAGYAISRYAKLFQLYRSSGQHKEALDAGRRWVAALKRDGAVAGEIAAAEAAVALLEKEMRGR